MEYLETGENEKWVPYRWVVKTFSPYMYTVRCNCRSSRLQFRRVYEKWQTFDYPGRWPLPPWHDRTAAVFATCKGMFVAAFRGFRLNEIFVSKVRTASCDGAHYSEERRGRRSWSRRGGRDEDKVHQGGSSLLVLKLLPLPVGGHRCIHLRAEKWADVSADGAVFCVDDIGGEPDDERTIFIERCRNRQRIGVGFFSRRIRNKANVRTDYARSCHPRSGDLREISKL